MSEADLQKLTLKEENKSKYNREVVICDQDRQDIVSLYNEIDNLIDDDTTLSEIGEEQRQIEIDSKSSTIKVMVDEYKNYK